MDFGSTDAGPMVRQNSKVMGDFGGDAHLKADRECNATGRDQDLAVPKCHTLVTCFSHSAQFFHFPIVCSGFESMRAQTF